jgi:hypothetical protein
MSSKIVGGYRKTNVKNSKQGYQEPSVITRDIPDHINGHSIRPNRVALKYLDFKKMLI